MATKCLAVICGVIMQLVNTQNIQYNIQYPDRIFFNDEGDRYPSVASVKHDLVAQSEYTIVNTQVPTIMSARDNYGTNLLAGDNIVGTNILAPRKENVNNPIPQNNPAFPNNIFQSNFGINPFANFYPSMNSFGINTTPSSTLNSQAFAINRNLNPTNSNLGSNAFQQNSNSNRLNNFGNNNNNVRLQTPNVPVTTRPKPINNAFSHNSNVNNINKGNNAFAPSSNFGNNRKNILPITSINTDFYEQPSNQPSTEKQGFNNNGANTIGSYNLGWNANATRVEAAALSISDFGLEMMRILHNKRGNLVISPFSITILLALLQQGALSNTQRQISEVLQLSPEQSAEGFKRIMRTIQKSNSRSILNVANGIFLGDSFNLNPSYKRSAMEDFSTEVATMMFSRPNAAQKINKWVSKNTNNYIENLIPADAVNAETQLVLVNAVFFKGLWAVKFRPESTVQKPFYGIGRSPTVWFMRMHRFFKMDTDKDIRSDIIILPFESETYSLVIILPAEGISMGAVIGSLTKDKLLAYQNFSQKEVSLVIPKFVAKADTDLFQVFQMMGIVDMFGSHSDLMGIGHFNNYPPKVSSALHSAMLSIDEQGGVAAASTSFAAIALSNDEPAYSFVANRPFLAVLWDNQISTPLFMAKIEDPSA